MNEKTDDQIIDEAVSAARQMSKNPNWVTSETAQHCIRQAFGQRPQPGDVVRRFMNKFCSP